MSIVSEDWKCLACHIFGDATTTFLLLANKLCYFYITQFLVRKSLDGISMTLLIFPMSP
jgi:hypothetical protein